MFNIIYAEEIQDEKSIFTMKLVQKIQDADYEMQCFNQSILDYPKYQYLNGVRDAYIDCLILYNLEEDYDTP